MLSTIQERSITYRPKWCLFLVAISISMNCLHTETKLAKISILTVTFVSPLARLNWISSVCIELFESVNLIWLTFWVSQSWRTATSLQSDSEAPVQCGHWGKPCSQPSINRSTTWDDSLIFKFIFFYGCEFLQIICNARAGRSGLEVACHLPDCSARGPGIESRCGQLCSS